MSTFRINIHETIFFLSDTLNLVSRNQMDHGKRVAFLAVAFAKALHWNDKQIDDLFLASILHDCGISKTSIYEKLVNFEGKNAGNHCAKGAQLLNESPPLAYLSEYILHHHVDWEELTGIDLWEKVKIFSNCINMADRIDFLCSKYLTIDANILASKEKIRNLIEQGWNTEFNPDLVDVFLDISKPEAFWLTLDKGYNSGYAKSWITQKASNKIDFVDLKSIVMIFSRMVDAKSYYSKHHSEGVANLSRYLGELLGLSELTCDKLELAGLLHDLGKLRVPDQILDKASDLNESEHLILQRHSYDTFDIIKDIQGFEDISTWASQHHERSDGSGYPYHLHSKDLSLESKIVATADVFQSLSQCRPHRDKLLLNDILHLLKQQVQNGKLDKEVVLMIENNPDKCWKAATSIN